MANVFVERSRGNRTMQKSWLAFALASAFFAGLTAILGKVGVSQINSNLATFIRTIVILIVTAGIICWRSEWEPLNRLSTRALNAHRHRLGKRYVRVQILLQITWRHRARKPHYWGRVTAVKDELQSPLKHSQEPATAGQVDQLIRQRQRLRSGAESLG